MNVLLVFVSEIRYLLSGSPRQVVFTAIFVSMFAHQLWSGTSTGIALLLAAAFAVLLCINAARTTRIRLREQPSEKVSCEQPGPAPLQPLASGATANGEESETALETAA